jgi:Domain of unknown function (DUF4041)/T5orf172 domain
MKNPWYYSTWFIALLFSLWILIFPLIIGVILIKNQQREQNRQFQKWEAEKLYEISKFKKLNNIQEKLMIEGSKLVTRMDQDVKNEKLILQKEAVRQSLIINLRQILFAREVEINDEQQKINKNQLQKELESMYSQKVKEIARTTLIFKIKNVAINREISDNNNTLNRQIHQLRRLKRLKEAYQKEVITLRDEFLYQSFGFYDFRYDLENSREYKVMLDKVRSEQKEAVKYNNAVNSSTSWALNNSVRKGEAMTKKNIKMIVRSFNNECEAIIHKVKFNNVEVCEKKIRKARAQIDKLNSYHDLSITDQYLELKLEELYLAYEYAKKQREEREEQRRQNEILREERRVMQEIEERRKILAKEEQHFQKAINKYNAQLSNASEYLRISLESEIIKAKNELRKINAEKSELDYRVRNAKAGYVYVISNIGAFGENTYKIGMTRRLEPQERIRELSGASVPYLFDVHAMIFSEDAPKLENVLHKTFNDYRVNKVNNRKEFFRVSLKEIEKVIREHHHKPVEFVKVGMAQEYRETKMIERKSSQMLTVS